MILLRLETKTKHKFVSKAIRFILKKLKFCFNANKFVGFGIAMNKFLSSLSLRWYEGNKGQ